MVVYIVFVIFLMGVVFCLYIFLKKNVCTRRFDIFAIVLLIFILLVEDAWFHPFTPGQRLTLSSCDLVLGCWVST